MNTCSFVVRHIRFLFFTTLLSFLAREAAATEIVHVLALGDAVAPPAGADVALTRRREARSVEAQAPTQLPRTPAAAAALTDRPIAGDSLCFAFFPDAVYTVTVTRVQEVYGGVVLIEGEGPAPGALRHTSVIGPDGVRHELHDFTRGMLYQAVGPSARELTIREYSDALRPPLVSGGDAELEMSLREGLSALRPDAGPLDGSAAIETNDLMIVFDRPARDWADLEGGGTTAFAVSAVARLNTALANSGIACRIRLVHTWAMITSLTNDLGVILNDLRSGSGAFISIPYFRLQTGADLITVFTDTGSAYGVVGKATSPTTPAGDSENSAFSVCAVQAVNNSQTLAHEIGHNLGAGHSKYQEDAPGPGLLADYAAGWYFTGTNAFEYHTIMAYNSDGQNSYHPCDYFSTPAVSWQGVAVGNAADGDNVRVMNVLKSAVAQYRDRVDTVTVAFDANGGSVTPASATFVVGEPYSALPTPSLEGQTFLGWVCDYCEVTADMPASPLYTTLRANWQNTTPPQLYTYSNGKIYTYNGAETVVNIPATLGGVTVVSIESGAFRNNTTAHAVTLPHTVTSIGACAFMDMTNLRGISLSSNLQSLGADAFHGCAQLTNLVCHPGIQTIPERLAYHCDSLTAVSLPAGVTSIWPTAFSHCTALTTIALPASVVGIGHNAFYSCTNLTHCALAEGLVSIGSAAFGGCLNLRGLTLPNSLSQIGDFAFYRCASLMQIELPTNLVSLGNSAFSECRAVVGDVAIPASVTSIGSSAFAACPGITAFCVDAANSAYADAAGVLYTKDGVRLLQCPACKSGAFTIPPGVTTIDPAALFSCRQLTSITLPDSLTTIGTSAFESCTALKTLVIPASVTNIDLCAFSCCFALSNLYFTGNAPALGQRLLENSQHAVVHVKPGASGWNEQLSGRPVIMWRPEPATDRPFGRTSAGFTFTIGNAMGEPVAVDMTADLAAGAWAELPEEDLLADGDACVVTDPDAPLFPVRFYRLRWR